MKNITFKIASATIIVFLLPIFAASAQKLSSGQILDALKPKQKIEYSKTRTFGTPKKNAAGPALNSRDRGFIRGLNATRAIRVEERDKLIDIVEKSELPSINVQIFFDYDSDRIKPNSFADLNEIGEALLDVSLVGSMIMLNGHTDASGSRYYNQELSERRALSVKRYLTNRLYISPDRLVVSGFGEDRLRYPGDPYDAQNRRVEIVNLGE